MQVSGTRRYDIDALRVIAIGMLLVYHTAIGFQSWGYMVGFITNETPLPSIWPVMAIFNIWRIPLLFVVSGMGVYLALQNRGWKQLFIERGRRIILPFVFGYFIIVPIHLYILQSYYAQEQHYIPSAGHLWFLGNIFLYVLLLSPVFNYLKQNPNGKIVHAIKKLLGTPLGLLAVMAAFMIESILTRPAIYELYAMTWHGFFLGLVAFGFGFCFMQAGTAFWEMLLKWKWWFLVVALMLFSNRFLASQMKVHTLLLVAESNLWIFLVFAFSCKYLNRESKLLKFLSPAVYPIYIVHMIVLYLISYWVFPLEINSWLKFLITTSGTLLGSFLLYVALIKRVKVLRPLFGLGSA